MADSIFYLSFLQTSLYTTACMVFLKIQLKTFYLKLSIFLYNISKISRPFVRPNLMQLFVSSLIISLSCNTSPPVTHLLQPLAILYLKHNLIHSSDFLKLLQGKVLDMCNHRSLPCFIQTFVQMCSEALPI